MKTNSKTVVVLSIVALMTVIQIPPEARGESYPYGQGGGFSNYSNPHSMGYQFLCDGHGVVVTELGAYSGTSGSETKYVGLYTNAGALLGSATVVIGSYGWEFAPISPPNVKLNYGEYYRVTVFCSTYAYKGRGSWAGDENIRWTRTYYSLYQSSPVFPTSQGSSSYLYGFPDIGYIYAPHDFNVPLSDDDGVYTISWSPVNGADSYEIKESDDGINWHEVEGLVDQWTDVGNVTSLDIGSSTTKPFGIYRYKIRAVYDIATTPRYSEERISGNDCMVGYISVPQVSSTGTFMIFWPTINGATGYDLQELESTSPPSPTAWTTVTPLYLTVNYRRIENKTSGTWWYRVQPRGLPDPNPPPDSWFVNDQWMYGLNGCVIGAPPAPATLTVPTQSHTGQYNVSWGSSLGATNYELQEFTSAGIASPYRIYYGPGTSFTVTGKTSGTYYYRVRAANGAGFGGWNFSTNGCAIVPPPPPATLTVDPVSRDGTINTSWPVVDGATTYELQEDRSSTFDDAPLSVFHGNGTSHMVLGKTSGTYYFRVRSINGAGAGAWRTAPNGCQIAPPYAPTNFTVPTGTATGSFVLDWDSMDGALTYEVEEDTDAAFTAPILVYSGPVSAF
ncbi:MAG: hypothetical protein ACYTFG_15655, partial [Planctomycetota bacterium]